MSLNSIKIYFGFVEDIEDIDEIFRIKAKIKGFTDKINKDDLPWYYPWYGINYLPEIGDEVPLIIFNDEFVNGFYTKKADLNKRDISKDDYKTYLEIYKRESDKVKLIYEKSKGITFEYDITQVNIDKDKIINKVTDNSKSTLTKSDLDIIINELQLRVDNGGFTFKKADETLKKIMVDLLAEIEKMQFKNTVGQTLLLINKPKFTAIKMRIKSFFTN